MNLTRQCLALILLVAIYGSPAYSQTFDNWVDSQVSAVLDKQTVGQNGKGTDRQKESPATDPRSTSLVDESSATDFISMATNLIPVSSVISQPSSSGSSTSGSGTSGSGTVTASLYALLAGLNKESPTDPDFYKDHINARRMSFTVGTATSTQAVDNTAALAKVFGAKALLINHRELYTKDNLSAISMVQRQLSIATAASAILKDKIKRIMFEDLEPRKPDGTIDETKYPDFLLGAFGDATFSNTLNALSARAKKQIQDLIDSSIDPFSALRTRLQDTYDQISKGMQMSVAYTANIRSGQGDNNHRAELIFDYGLSQAINWTINASGDYTDRKGAFPSSAGGRFATAFQGNLTKPNSAWGRLPLQLSVSGEADWLSRQKPQYTFQAGLSIPLVPGITIPVVYRFANRVAILNQSISQKDSEARLGLSFDLSRIAEGFGNK